MDKSLMGNNIGKTCYKKWRERDILNKCTKLVINKVTQNLPIKYSHKVYRGKQNGYYGEQSHLHNHSIVKKSARSSSQQNGYYGEQSHLHNHSIVKKNGLLIFSEAAEGDGIKWASKRHTLMEWKSFLFQIWHGLYVLHDKLKLVHNDLHLKNILYLNTHNSKCKYWKYVMNNNTFYVPNKGNVFLIWDFGLSESLLYKHQNMNIVKKKYDANIDIYFFNRLLYYKLINLKKKAISARYTLDDLIQLLKTHEDIKFIKMVKKNTSGKKRNRNVYKFKLKRKLIKYIMDTDRFKEFYEKRLDQFIDKNCRLYAPPNEIVEIIKQISKYFNYDALKVYTQSQIWKWPMRWKDSKYVDIVGSAPTSLELIKKFLPEFLKKHPTTITFTL